MINIEGLPKAAVLAALYNQAKKPSLEVVKKKNLLFRIYQIDPETVEQNLNPKFYFSSRDMTQADVEAIFEKEGNQNYHFHHFYTRKLYVDISEDSFNPRGYNICNGENAAEKAISALREELSKNQNPQQAEEEVFSGLGTGWFNQYSQEIETEAQAEIETEETQANEKEEIPVNSVESRGSRLNTGWFAQYSAALEKENKDAEKRDEAKPHEAQHHQNAQPESRTRSRLQGGWFNAYSQQEPERQSTQEQSEDDEAVYVLLKGLKNMKLK